MKALGCVMLLIVLGFIALEIWVYILVSEALDDQWLGVALAIIASSFFGFKLMRYQASKMPEKLMQNKMGQQGVAVFGAVLIFFPGLVSTSFGMLLQLPPIQHIFAGISAKVVASMIKIAAEKMGGQMPGGMGGMGPMGAGPFPGMQPDQQMRGGKVYDAEAEKPDEKLN